VTRSGSPVSGPIHWGDAVGPLVHIRTGKAAAGGFPVALRTV
jgi:hypothetical protein